MIKKNKRFYDKNGDPHGYWEVYHYNGNLHCKGYCIHGKRHGYWEDYYENGELKYKGNLIHDKMHGLRENNEYFYLGKKIYITTKNKILI